MKAARGEILDRCQPDAARLALGRQFDRASDAHAGCGLARRWAGPASCATAAWPHRASRSSSRLARGLARRSLCSAAEAELELQGGDAFEWLVTMWAAVNQKWPRCMIVPAQRFPCRRPHIPSCPATLAAPAWPQAGRSRRAMAARWRAQAALSGKRASRQSDDPVSSGWPWQTKRTPSRTPNTTSGKAGIRGISLNRN